MKERSVFNMALARVVTGLALLFSSVPTEASHFRGAAMIPSVDGSGLLTLRSTSFWRPTFTSDIDESSNPFVSGVGTMADVPGSRVVDTSDSRFTQVTNVHTIQLPGAGTYSISAESCCRVGGIINAAEDFWEMNSTIVWDGTGAHTPIQFNFNAVQPEIVRGANYSDNLGAVAAPGLTLSYDQALNLNINSQPPGFTINPSTGALSIPAANTATYADNPTANVGADYAFSGNINASDGSRVEFDWLFDAVATGPVNNAPDVNDATLNILAGTPVNFTATGSDPDGDSLTWSLNGLLGLWGSAPNAPSFNPATQLFSWNSTGAPLGSYFAQFRASDPLGLTDVGILTINVQRPGPAVPEPSTLLLLGTGMVAAVSFNLLQRRRQANGS